MAVLIASQSEPIPGYRLIERLGRGGFGEVWKAEAPGGLLKAIKFVFGDLEGAGENGRPAEQELKALARVKTIRHPYILSLERYDIIDGQLIIVMELADRNLWDRFRECRNQGLEGIPRDELLRYMAETAEALDLMNNQYQLQHLDIKPQNIFLIHNHVKVADFGLVKDFEGMRATVTGGVTPVYAAPETFDNWASRYSDQYSLAIVYQELLTGKRPFDGSNTRQLLLQHISGVPDVSPLPPSDRDAINRALSKNPEDRFPSCTDLVNALQRASAGPVSRPVPVMMETRLPQPAPQLSPLNPSTPTPPTTADELIKSRPLRTLHTAGVRQPLTEGHATPQLTQLRAPVVQTAQVANLKLAPPERTGPGCLRPAVVIGLGQLGQIALTQLRQAVRDRFGADRPLPLLQLLQIDTDPEAISSLVNSTGESLLQANEVILTRLNRPSHYLKSPIPNLDKWIDQAALHRIPRNPVTSGIRSLGRLALFDHYCTISQRLTAALAAALDEAALNEAEQVTGLKLRTNRPRVYVVTSLCGGTGSGMFIDLAYIVRQHLRALGYTAPEVQALLFVPTIDRTPQRTLAVANTYAALAELAYFSSPSIRYECRFDAKEPAMLDPDKPFSRCVLLPLPRNPEQHALQAAGSCASGLLLRELFSAIGPTADSLRSQRQPTSGKGGLNCQSVGMYTLSWPRQRLLRRTVERFTQRLLQRWIVRDGQHHRDAIAQWLASEWTRRQFEPEMMTNRLQQAVEEVLRQPVEVIFDAYLQGLGGQGGPPPKLDATAAVGVLDRLLQLVGKPEQEHDDPIEGSLKAPIDDMTRHIIAECDDQLTELAVYFIEQPQFRLAGAEEAIRQLGEKLQLVIGTFEQFLDQAKIDTHETFSRLFPLIGALKSTFTPRRSAIIAELYELLQLYPRKRLQCLLVGGMLTIYRTMANNLTELMRDVGSCRPRIAEIIQAIGPLNADPDEADPLGHGAPILPAGCRTLDEAADELIAKLKPDEILAFDKQIQSQIRRQFESLVNVCLNAVEYAEPFRHLLIQQGIAFLSHRFGQTDTASQFLSTRDEQDAQRDLHNAFDEAAPELVGPRARIEDEIQIVNVPAGPAGQQLQRLLTDALPDLPIQFVSGGDDIVIYREQTVPDLRELPHMSMQVREVCKQISAQEHISLNSRRDLDW
jgi:serine/threonine protein kinase